MYTCFHSVGLPNRPLSEVVALVADAGYSAIELNAETLPWAKAHITPVASADERHALVDVCRRHGLSIPAVGAHINMVGEAPDERTAAIEYVMGCIDIARDVGSPFVHILSGARAPNVDRGEAWRWFLGAVERTSHYAESLGIGFGIEAIAGHVFYCVDDYHHIRRDLPGLPIRVNFDPSHLEVQNENPRRVIDELGDQIVHVHLKDGKGTFPDFQFPPLGEGTIDFTSLAGGLKALGYEGALSIEYEAQVFGFKKSEANILKEGKAFCDHFEHAG